MRAAYALQILRWPMLNFRLPPLLLLFTLAASLDISLHSHSTSKAPSFLWHFYIFDIISINVILLQKQNYRFTPLIFTGEYCMQKALRVRLAASASQSSTLPMAMI